MPMPPGVTAKTWTAALAAFRTAVGADWVFTTAEDIALYRDAYSPFWGEPEERLASAAVAPATVEQVQQVVRAANQYKIPIYPVSTGKNLGYGGSAPNLSGSVVLDLKRMNRVLEVDDKRHFAMVEPGVAYFDLYKHIQDRNLKVWIDCPDPGWGSLIGNSLDHGVGYTWNTFRDHFGSHCGMEVVLPNGEIMRTGMGALPGSNTWGEYRYGFGPYVDGLFSQGNFGVVTKMGFHLFPQPEAYCSTVVSAPRRADLIPLVEEVNFLEHAGLIGQPSYGSPLRRFQNDPAYQALLAKSDFPSNADLDTFQRDKGVPMWSCELQFYGPARAITGNREYAQDRLRAAIPSAVFTNTDVLRMPLTPEQQDKAHKVAFGIPNLAIFSGGARSANNPNPRDGHAWFSPVIPKSGEAIMQCQEVFAKAAKAIGGPALYGPLNTPSTWMFRAFVMITGFSISRSDPAVNKSTRDTINRLIDVAAEHGWGEYRTPPAFQDHVMEKYGFNNHALLRFHETLKDAIDPNGIISAGRSGIWPKAMRKVRK